jgi:hypothetical protein
MQRLQGEFRKALEAYRGRAGALPATGRVLKIDVRKA